MEPSLIATVRTSLSRTAGQHRLVCRARLITPSSGPASSWNAV
jgi:hypothetical protein